MHTSNESCYVNTIIKKRSNNSISKFLILLIIKKAQEQNLPIFFLLFQGFLPYFKVLEHADTQKNPLGATKMTLTT